MIRPHWAWHGKARLSVAAMASPYGLSAMLGLSALSPIEADQSRPLRRLPNLLDWLNASKPDVVCLQELRCSERDCPAAPIKEAGYSAVWRGEKAWNGVAILARHREPVRGLGTVWRRPTCPWSCGTSATRAQNPRMSATKENSREDVEQAG